jgi:hypothetical protein
LKSSSFHFVPFSPPLLVLCFIDDWKVFNYLFPKALGHGPKFIVYFGCSIAELKNLLGFTFIVKLDVIFGPFSLYIQPPPPSQQKIPCWKWNNPKDSLFSLWKICSLKKIFLWKLQHFYK